MLPLAFSPAPGSGSHKLQSKQGLGSSAGILLGCWVILALLLPLGTIPWAEGGRELVDVLAGGLDGRSEGDCTPGMKRGRGKRVGSQRR